MDRNGIWRDILKQYCSFGFLTFWVTCQKFLLLFVRFCFPDSWWHYYYFNIVVYNFKIPFTFLSLGHHVKSAHHISFSFHRWGNSRCLTQTHTDSQGESKTQCNLLPPNSVLILLNQQLFKILWISWYHCEYLITSFQCIFIKTFEFILWMVSFYITWLVKAVIIFKPVRQT